MFGANIAQGRKIDTFEESLTGAKQDWRYGEVHLIDQALAKILLDDIDSATNANIFASGGFLGTFKRGGNAFRHEVEGSSLFGIANGALRCRAACGLYRLLAIATNHHCIRGAVFHPADCCRP